MDNVSILIPCYNSAPWIKACVESAIAQEPKEIILIDDGSTDGTQQILSEYQNKIAVIFRENKGAQFTRNQLLELSSCEWLQFLDSDDELKPNKIKSQLEKNNTNSSIVYCDRLLQSSNSETPSACNDDILDALVSWEKIPNTSCCLFHRSVFDRAKWNEAPYARAGWHEAWLFFELWQLGKKFQRTPGFSVYYRVGERGRVSTSDRSRRFLSRKRLSNKLKNLVKGELLNKLEVANRRFNIELLGGCQVFYANQSSIN